MIRQRARQFFRHDVRPGPADRALAEHYLDPRILPLFLEQEPRDIVHAANTARWLLDRGHDERDLIQAALLHDIGKGEQRRRDRVTHVVASWLRVGRLVADPNSSLATRRAVARSRMHAHAGATLLEAHGVSARVVALVKKHHERAGQDGMLKLLQEADSAT